MPSHPLTTCRNIKPGTIKRFVVGEQAILLANIKGEFFAVADLCTHDDAILSNGALKDDCIECPLHGSRFDLRTGIPKEEPATEPIRTFPLEIRDDIIFIDLTD